MASSLSVYDTSKPESLIFNPWFNPCDPQPIITIFFPSKTFVPFLNSEAFIKSHFPNCVNWSISDSVLK